MPDARLIQLYADKEKTQKAYPVVSEDAIIDSSGEKPIQRIRESIENLPSAYPNPNKIVFTGAVSAEYDGTDQIIVNIPDTSLDETARQDIEWLEANMVVADDEIVTPDVTIPVNEWLAQVEEASQAIINSNNTVDEKLILYAKKSEIPTTLPASDVSEWAKSPTKPAYTAEEVGALPYYINLSNKLTNVDGVWVATYYMDKTNSEVYEAAQSGKQCIGLMTTNKYYATNIRYNVAEFVLIRKLSTGIKITIITITDGVGVSNELNLSDINELKSSKLSISQGTENAGKILIINEDGLIEPCSDSYTLSAIIDSGIFNDILAEGNTVYTDDNGKVVVI